MKLPSICRVIHLTLGLASLLCSLAACSLINEHYAEPCNYRAYTRSVLVDHLSSRFTMDSPVRMAVIPFSVPANLAAYDVHRPGLGNELAWQVQADFLSTGTVPIVEVFNRQDWPGKSEEFYTGNFGAISLAREAGYDLVLVGSVPPMRELDKMTALTKLIETESGLTLWYGQSSVSSYEPELSGARSWVGLERHVPSELYLRAMQDKLSQCIVRGILDDEVVPE